MIFDILFLVFIVAGFYQGYKNGIIYSVFSLLGYFLGIMLALKFSFMMVNFLHGYLDTTPKVMAIISLVLIFVLVVVLMRLIAWGLEQILKSASLNLPNQIIGGIIHSLIGLYVMCVLVWFANKLGVFPESQKESSHVYPYIANLAPQVVDLSGQVIPYFSNAFRNFDELFGTHLAK